jgi:pilus assembly protein CpaC
MAGRGLLAVVGLIACVCFSVKVRGQAPLVAPRSIPATGLLTLQQPGGAPQPVPGRQPQPQPQPVGPRTSDLFGGVHPRLEGLPAGLFAPVGTTPVPDQKTLEKFNRFVGPFVDPENTITLVVGRPRIWTLKQAPFRLQVGDQRTMSYTTIGNDPRQLSLIGEQVGTTVLNLWFGDPDDLTKQTILSYLVQVIPDPEIKERLERVYKALEEEINKAFPDAYVCLFLVGDKLVVAGEVKDSVEATKILQILRTNAPTTGTQQGTTQQAANVPVTQASFTGPQAIGPNGQVANSLEQYIVQGETNIVNLLRIPGEQQVMLRVVVAEVNRSAARSIGLNETVRNRAGTTVFAQTTGQLTSNITAVLDANRITLAIEALRTLNLARSLAEPNLVTMNGFPAAFLAGGEFPVPVVTGATSVGLQGVNFVPFGVQLSFIPYVTDKDRIRLQVNAQVSVRDPAIGTNFGANTNATNTTFVPGLNTRNVQTTVEMREGQTLAIAGLIQNNLGADTTRIPLAGDLPIVGNLFGQNRTQASEQELVLLVTPELVHPLEPKEVPPLPGSDYFEPGDLEFYLYGRLESRRTYDYRSPVMTDIHRMAAYRRCELLYFAGPCGHCDNK